MRMVHFDRRGRAGRRALAPAVAAAALAALAWAGPAPAAAPPRFSGTLSPAQVAALGLDKLSPAELAALDAAVESYRRAGETAAAGEAARTAIANYRRREEPKQVAQAVAQARREAAEARIERIEATIVGPFSGWSGRTLFELDNGQIWRQVDPDVYYLSPAKGVPVEIYRSSYGSYRLHLKNGAWVTVTRVR